MIKFLIDHLDPLGQGVSKRVDGDVRPVPTFIPKTLPGEQGSARIIKSAKGVEFAELVEIFRKSSRRIEPECPHFHQCPGCDYQHVSYADELAYKKSALLFILRFIDLSGCEVELIPAFHRFFYRNRVQLHYRHKYIGLINANTDSILEIPQCRLMSPQVKYEVDKLYATKKWTEEHRGRGHVEIYEKEGGISLQWNQSYAGGGFSQVNSEMNIQLKKWIKNRFLSEKYKTIVDIFSGNGNLSDDLMLSGDIRRIMVDSHEASVENTDNTIFIKQDLFSKNAAEAFYRKSKLQKVDILLLDPPRGGFPSLSEWYKKFKPEYIVYVSCNPATLSRDLNDLMKYNKKIKITDLVLLDMFPSTRHFETVVILKHY